MYGMLPHVSDRSSEETVKSIEELEEPRGILSRQKKKNKMRNDQKVTIFEVDSDSD